MSKTSERFWRNVLREKEDFSPFGEKEAQRLPHPSLQVHFSAPCVFTGHMEIVTAVPENVQDLHEETFL